MNKLIRELAEQATKYKWKLNRDLDQQDANLKKSNYEKRIKWDIDREA